MNARQDKPDARHPFRCGACGWFCAVTVHLEGQRTRVGGFGPTGNAIVVQERYWAEVCHCCANTPGWAVCALLGFSPAPPPTTPTK